MDSKTEKYYIDCGIRTKWHDKELSGFTNDDDALQKVRNYLDRLNIMTKKGVGLYLWGANGTGKSHLLNCSAKILIEEHYKVKVFSLDDIVNRFTASWYSDSERQSLYEMLQGTHFLMIDEFGKNIDGLKMPDVVKKTMESIIRYRVQMNRPIWFSSNTDPKYVSEVFSEDVASLLRESVIPINVGGEDYRKKIQKDNKTLLQ